ncbi:hypothetical protein PsYK624_024960 [Phanerochaete sordida]|uniref:Uncharacterized protein n=1 Tax=Phanerochaete sordida TaxID=48140 RepID=A0A9P3G1C0_9APHY|nr:hypothetical protein PsYK624_024960 [Phanerochaete sordida]
MKTDRSALAWSKSLRSHLHNLIDPHTTRWPGHVSDAHTTTYSAQAAHGADQLTAPVFTMSRMMTRLGRSQLGMRPNPPHFTHLALAQLDLGTALELAVLWKSYSWPAG